MGEFIFPKNKKAAESTIFQQAEKVVEEASEDLARSIKMLNVIQAAGESVG